MKLKAFVKGKYEDILKLVYNNDEKILKINYKDYINLLQTIIQICEKRGRF